MGVVTEELKIELSFKYKIIKKLNIKGKRILIENKVEIEEEIDIFYGIITRIKLEQDGNLYKFVLEGDSYSLILDLKKEKEFSR